MPDCHSQSSRDLRKQKIAPRTRSSKSTTGAYYNEEGQLNHDNAIPDQLPPYENISPDRFAIALEETLCCDYFDSAQKHPNQISCQSSTEGAIFILPGDFVLFPSHWGSTSDLDSSVASCFTNDWSYSTPCTDSTPHDLYDGRSPLSGKMPEDLMSEICPQKNPHDEFEPTKIAAEWLCNVVDLSIDRMHLDDTTPREGPTLATVDEEGNIEDCIEVAET